MNTDPEPYADTVAMTDGQLADAILRKIAADRESAILVERYEKGGISGLLDTSWFDLTDEEAAYLDRIRAEQSDGGDDT